MTSSSRPRVRGAAAAAVLALVAACGADAPTCVPGASVPCACTDGTAGAQVCLPSGARFASCACDGSPPDDRVCAPSCGAIDFLFVVDNSLSMKPIQDELVASFDGFYDEIRTRFPGTSLHLLVTDSDGDDLTRILCEEGCDTVVGDGASELCEGYVCGSLDARTACDVALGAGTVRPLGDAASNRACGVPEGRRHLRDDDPDLEATFDCVARVGASGDGDERPIGAMLAALERSRPGECNEGFLRDDALLVVVLITDASSVTASELGEGSPAEWRRRLLDAKCGDETSVVVVGFVADGTLDPPEPDRIDDPEAYCDERAEDPCCELCEALGFRDADGELNVECTACFDATIGQPPRGSCWAGYTGDALPLADFIDRFEGRGFRANVCEADYRTPFAEAVEVIDEACTLL